MGSFWNAPQVLGPGLSAQGTSHWGEAPRNTQDMLERPCLSGGSILESFWKIWVYLWGEGSQGIAA